jgi:hypothetical protein
MTADSPLFSTPTPGGAASSVRLTTSATTSRHPSTLSSVTTSPPSTRSRPYTPAITSASQAGPSSQSSTWRWRARKEAGRPDTTATRP